MPKYRRSEWEAIMADSLYTISDLHLSLPDLAHKPLFGKAPRIDILKGIDLTIPRGDVLGIVGGSGSGKTTLGRAIIRLLQPTGGSIHFEGQDISHMQEAQLRPLRRKFQMIFQDPMSSLNPRHTVATIIQGPLRLNGFDRAPERASEALDHVGLPKAIGNRYPQELSGGQRQRVGIARAIAMEPTFILADEILSGLDVSSQAQVLVLLERLVSDLGLTLAFISHDLSVVRRLCKTVAVLHAGKIVEYANTTTIFNDPSSDYTRELLAAIPLPDPAQEWF